MAGLVKGLKGEPPFDGDPFPRLPWGGRSVLDKDIAFIERWIDSGCPEADESAVPSTPTSASMADLAMGFEEHPLSAAATREAARQRRQMIFETLRGPGQENIYQLPRTALRPRVGPVGMPDLCGDNPMTNVAASKFLRLGETVLFFLRQWVAGRFIDERAEGFDRSDPALPPTGEALDRGVLGNVLGGSR